MLFRQLFDSESSTYTYLLADEASREAVLIDPVLEQLERDAGLVQELGLKLQYVLDTHIHADHVTASGLLRERLGGKTVLSEGSGAVCADELVKQGDRLGFGAHELEVRETPGHTNGCLTYVCHEGSMVFTGDALLVRGCGRTDFQQGNARRLYQSVHEQIFSLPDRITVYPAHDYKGRTATSVGEEKRWNPRLGQGKSLQEFVEIMGELNLPYPRKIDQALPSNLRCGLVPAEASGTAVTESSAGDWAPIELSQAGVPEVDAPWLRKHLEEVLVLDVRQPEEFFGELGHIPSAELLPLDTVAASAGRWPKHRPIVTVCRSGGRSGKAALALLEQGFSKVASLRGGMRDWSGQSLPVEHGRSPSSVTSRQG